MTIDLYGAEKGGKHTIQHDLNFAKPRYEATHTISFKNPNAALSELLRKSGPLPEDANGARKKGASDAERKKKRAAQVDMDKLADGLVKLSEDDLLQVVQMIHDNKSEETYTKNDVERSSDPDFPDEDHLLNQYAEGEFHVDLYTLPDPLVRMLWEYVQQRA
jgi:transcription initiation factor IIF auxiliary subunit